MSEYRYYIQNQLDNPVDITDDKKFYDYLISEENVVEHIQAQLAFAKSGHPDHKIQSIIVGVTTAKFIELVDHLSTMYKGFKRMYYFNRNSIPIKLDPHGLEIIRVVDTETINND